MINREQIAKEVKLSLIQIIKHERFNWHDELKATEVEGWDSLTHMTLITAIEDRYGFRFKLKELNQLKTVGSLLDLIEAKLHA
ncbi:MAG: acyl carrier protein [Chitinophagaceae bacterium]